MDGSTDGATIRTAISNWLAVAAVGGSGAGVDTLTGLQAAAADAVRSLADEHTAESRSLYEQGLNGSPFICLAVIPLDAATEGAADTVMAELAAGTTFADAATKYSVDPTLAASNGIVLNPNTGAQCQLITDTNQELVASLTAASATVGTPIAIEFQGFPVVVLLRAFDDLATEVQRQVAGPIIDPIAKSLIVSADPFVDSRFGRWDAASGAVVALGNG